MRVAPFAISAVCYFLFNAAMFAGLEAQAGFAAPRRGAEIAVFAGNYLAFAALSMLQFNLVANWLVICVLFLFEIKWAFRCPWRASLLCALLVSLVGLGANEFARSLCAIAFDVPQSAFSNDIGEEGNLKTVPVALGFLLGALLLCVQRRVLRHGETAVAYGNDRSRRFVLAMGVLGYLYLCSILLLYYVDVNALVVKVWALKASVSVFASLSLAFYYAYRTAAVIRRSEERRLLEREVAEREHEGDKLQDIVRRDELTGCCSRRFAEARIDELLGRGRPLSLAFVDVNDLKGVNDAGGHEDGDRYLTCVAAVLDDVASGPDDVLGRLGGDEFVVALPDVPAAVLRKRLEEARHRLRTQSDSERSPFSMSVSVGVASARPGDDAASLVARADAAMYEDKRAGKEAR